MLRQLVILSLACIAATAAQSVHNDALVGRALADDATVNNAHKRHRRHHYRRASKCKVPSSPASAVVPSASASVAIDTETTASAGASSSGNGSSKLGRALGWAMDDRLASLFTSSNIKTYYHWENPTVAGLSQMSYWPMLWGTSKLSMFQDVMSQYSDGNAPEWVMGFNEPDLPGQANMSPQAAAAAWKQYIQPWAAKGSKLVAPSLSWDHNWYQSFFDACDGCTFDAISMHWYGSVQDVTVFENAVSSIWAQFGKYAPELWIPEYSVTASSGGSEQEVMAFAKAATAWAESQSYITFIAWFGAWSANPDGYASSNGRFVDDNNQLTEIGKWWTS